MEKRCPRCEKTKLLEDFPRHRGRSDGHGAHCKACRTAVRDPEYHKAYYRRNRDRILAQGRAYRARPENKAKARERWEQYYAENAGWIKDYVTEWGRQNPSRRQRHREKWNAANGNKVRLYRRGANKFRAEHPPTPEAREYFAILEGDPCSYCGAPMEHVDHIVPVSTSRDSDWDNFTAACKKCNLSKGSKSLLHFLLKS